MSASFGRRVGARADATAPGETRRVPVAEQAPRTFGSYDYADAFTIITEPGDSRTAEQWARAALDRSPVGVRSLIPFVWRRVVGFRLGPRPSPDHVLGWRIVESTPEAIELRVESWQISGAIVVRVRENAVLFTTFLRYERRVPARALFVVLGPIHRFFVPRLLRWAPP